MSLRQIYKIERFKLFKKRVTLILLVCYILPLFYGVSIISNSSNVNVQGEFGVMMFTSVNWNMLAMTGVPEVFFCLIAAHYFAAELEQGQMRTLIVRVCNRKQMIAAKALSFITLMLLFYITFILFSIVIYYLFIVHTHLASGQIWDETYFRVVLTDLIYLLQIMMVSSIVMLLGLQNKAFVSFILGTGITIIFMVLQFFPVIKYFVPFYTASAIAYQHINNITAGMLCIAYLAFSVIPVLITSDKFSKIDIL